MLYIVDIAWQPIILLVTSLISTAILVIQLLAYTAIGPRGLLRSSVRWFFLILAVLTFYVWTCMRNPALSHAPVPDSADALVTK